MFLKDRYFAGYYSVLQILKIFPKNEKNRTFCFWWWL
jgi:hypothetical protein